MRARLAAFSDGYIPFLERFSAWWHGVESVSDTYAAPVDAASAKIEVSVAKPQLRWPPQRLEICRRLWGEGYILAGGPEHMTDFVKPLCLDPSMSVIDLSAGAGGGPQTISEVFKVWISALESDPELVALATDFCKRKGASRVEIAPWKPTKPAFAKGKYDCIYGRKVFYAVPDKAKLVAAIEKALKPGGQLLFSDFALADKDEERAPLKTWRGLNGDPQLWSEPEYRRALKASKLQVRVCSVDTEGFRSLILTGWANFVDGLQRSDLTREFVDHMMREAEIWLALIRALEDGQLQLVRIHALKPHQIL